MSFTNPPSVSQVSLDHILIRTPDDVACSADARRGFDAVLVDGDHNWYTVYNELKAIEELSETASWPFPLVILHDVGWPYARRDGYYNPDDIPQKYLQPHEKKGLRPGSTGLLEEGGYNWSLDNATSENGPRNGVLTAVEDFLEETRQEIELVRLSGLHGLGILIPARLKEQNSEVARFLETLELSPAMTRYVELLEDARLETEIRRLEAETRRLEQVRRLEQQLEDVQNSRGWRLLTKLDQFRTKVLKR